MAMRTDTLINPQRFLMVLALLVCTAAAYNQVAQFGYVNYDDDLCVPNNPHVRLGLSWSNVRWAFTSAFNGNWQPITWLSHMVDVSLFGISPAGHHVSNVAFHLLNVLTLLIALRTLGGQFWPSLVVAALFALHPLQVESVAWIAERKNLLSTFFGLLSVILYGKYVKDGGGPVRYASVWLCLAVGLMAKPMLVTFPLVYLLLDAWPLGRLRLDEQNKLYRCTKLLVEKLPFLCLSVASSVITYQVQLSSGAVQTFDSLPLSVRVSNALISCVVYLGKLLWPFNLAIPYAHPGHTLLVFQVILAAFTLATITALAIVWRKQKPEVLVGWLWYLGTLVPVIGLIQVGSQGMADRYTYVPFIGIYVVIASLIPWPQSTAQRRVIVGTLCALVLACIVVTRHQAAYWANGRTLFEHTLEVVPNSAVAQYNLGNEYLGAGDLERAESLFVNAIGNLPDMHEAWHNLSLVWLRQRNYTQAASGFRELLAESPNHLEAHYNLSVVYRATGEIERARLHLNRAIELDPAHAAAHDDLGSLDLEAGRVEEGLAHLRESVRLDPTNLGALVTLGAALAQTTQVVEAEDYLRRATALDPSDVAARYNLGLLLSRNGNWVSAEEQFRALEEVAPDDGPNLYQLGRTLSMQGKNGEAVEVLKRAVSSAPSLVEPQRLLEELLHASPRQ